MITDQTRTFGQWIKEERLAKKLTASECAERAKVSLPVWSRWESDDTTRRGKPFQPRRSTVETIAHALGVPVSEAMNAAGYTRPEPPNPDSEWMSILEGLNDQQRHALKRIAQVTKETLLTAGG